MKKVLLLAISAILLVSCGGKQKPQETIEIVEMQTVETSATAFIDLTGKTPQGTEISLSDYAGKGNVVLLDFWASWCPPCIREMPNLVQAYGKYHAKGFEIFAVSLDDDATKWKEASTRLGVTWPQISDLKGWDSELSGKYNIQSIPATVLIDGEGNVIAKDLRGDAFLNILKEIYGE